ncbi:DNA-directed RNA polymerase II core subunit rpb9 [Tieghemiomyces parasiticus]|uniref:DNA-directed RNA polymerase subunit n=1 Tax=Tieghemiomyces parasiticus TaxID=78921 RepID=A0A9W7ZX52_9FUNG|nr:DNA-directed RNA polymerase II core subunit rpb9 [Tieghemiomyces parasiticus]KAJ1927007.1 DNA-directed RNA polymerase II core subunit rpb9 [Tieghemiomyces parasiticus]
MATFRYCSECNNLLYPREQRSTRTLFFACRNCDHSEVAKSNCVYVHEIKHAPSEQTMVITDLSADPTLPRTTDLQCPKCGYNEAVFFQTQSRSADSRMTLYYVCCNKECSHRWTSA